MNLSNKTVEAYWDELEKIAQITPAAVHALADKKGIVWDSEKPGSAWFTAFCKKLTGKEHLDEMNPSELRTIYAAVQRIPGKQKT